MISRWWVCFALFLSTVAHSVQPESGWWWYQSEPGRGFSIEVQNNTLFFAGYLYDNAGNPVWYVSAGAYAQSFSTFNAPLLSFTGGQCLTCAFRPNAPGPSPGNLQLTFISPVAGTLTWPGGSIPITRFLYGTTNDHKRLAGRWVYTSVISTLASADWVNFDSTIVSNGNNFVAGTIQGNRVVVGGYLSGSYSVLIDSSTSYYDFFVCPGTGAGVEQLADCREWLYLKTGSPTGSGTPGQAFKYGAAPLAIAPMAASADKAATANALATELVRATAIAQKEIAADHVVQ